VAYRFIRLSFNVSTSPAQRSTNPAALARQARAVFVEQAVKLLTELSGSIGTRLSTLFEQSANAREAQDRRDAIVAYQQGQITWVQGTDRAWKEATLRDLSATSSRMPALNLELIGNDVVESKILSSRLAMRVADKAGWEFNDLQVRMKHLEGVEELGKGDILRAESVCQLMLEQWLAAGLKQEAWVLVQDVVQQNFADKIVKAYKASNEYLIAQGVMKEIDLRSNVKRTPNSGAGRAGMPGNTGAGALPSQAAGLDSGSGYAGAYAPTVGGFMGTSAASMPATSAAPMGAMSRAGNVSTQIADHVAKLRAQAAQFAAQQAAAAAGGMPGGGMAGAAPGMAGGMGGMPSAAMPRPGRAAVAQYAQDEAYETRMQTSATPLARARMRAQGVMGQLKQMLISHVVGFDGNSNAAPQMSPQLAAAMAPRTAMRTPGYQRTQQGSDSQALYATSGGASGSTVQAPAYAGVQVQIVEGMQPAQVNQALREQTKEIKKKADTDSEKATIEIVALMFQSILAEERIPTGVRVWFARLQMPVLRLALSEAEFFGSLQHPARRLIDRMGSCVLGFDANVGSAELEAEIKRIVQTIEQYPETGRRVFQLVFDEFEKFLTKFLTGSKTTQKIVSVAQQVEQKETNAIQYTIELRKMLGKLPMRDEIREFLFKVWAEVLAISAMKHGPQHAETLALKQVAADLLWAASAKPNRADRAKVIADLPILLKRLRSGMGFLGLTAAVQDAQIKLISDTLADAFMSKTATMDQDQVAEITQRIKHLEDFVSEEDVGDLPLDAESIEITLGIDMSGVEIITQGGSDPSQAMRAWAQELEQGTWFNLDHNGKAVRVQYAWRSKRSQLFLFADAAGVTYLFQLRRLASYLQAGLMTPVEDETLTVRATRAALTKLDANPERLLAVS
jgi:Protein of unknown function (DUF1631)